MEIIPNNEPVQPPAAPMPSVSDTFGHGWEIMKKYFPELLLLFFLEMVLSLPMGASTFMFNPLYYGSFTASLFNLFYGVIVMMPVSYGVSWVFLKAVRQEAFRVQDIFFAYQQFWNILVANLLVGLIIGAGCILLIVPGIIFACKLAFVPYLVMDRKMDAVEAVRTSWQMTRGHAGTIFLMGVVSIFVALGGLICLLVGIIPASIWISLAFAAIYYAVDSRQKATEGSV